MRKIRLEILLFAAMIALMVVGCAPTEKDAEAFVKNGFDYVTGKQSDKEINIDEENKKIWETIDEKIKENAELSAEEENKNSSDYEEQIMDLFDQAFEKIKYTVGSAKRTEDGFDVPVTIEQFLLLDKYEENMNKRTAEYLSGRTQDVDFDEISELFSENMIDTMKEAILTPRYGESSVFVFHLDVVDDHLEINEEKTSAEELHKKMFDYNFDAHTKEKDPENFKWRVDKVLNAAINGVYDNSSPASDNFIAFACHLNYEEELLYSQEEIKQTMIENGDSAELAEEKAAYIYAAQKMSKYECLDVTEKDGDPAIAVSVTEADPVAFMNAIVSEISAAITDEDYSKFSSDQEFYDYYNKLTFEECNKRINEMTYKEPEEYFIRFSKNEEDRGYILNSEDVMEILYVMALDE